MAEKWEFVREWQNEGVRSWSVTGVRVEAEVK